ncbi:histidine kinase [Streptomyces eurocidicus]|nr:sensor histidine kinase [Streptomyces eurocidicus]MBF6056391.1 sensor histidine kinase [Streptomyces eurocidicus]PNE33936.1 histidine kinase [Streptomyces eurocidicus]
MITAVVQAAVTIPFVVPRPADLPPATWPMYGLTSLQVLPLLWRTRAPLGTLLAVTAAGFGYLIADGPGQPLPYSSIVAIFTVAAGAGRRQRRVTVVLGLPLVVLGVALRENTAREHLFALFLFGMVYALGVLARTRQAYTEAVEARAAELERARVLEAERAAGRERARIAREMHDILSHAVSLMIVQAEAGPLVVRSDPARAEAAFDAISGAGRDAMAQLRRMLGVLKDDPGAGRGPQPTLAGLGALVDEVRRTGLEVGLSVSGEPWDAPQDVQVAVYRVVQEALTNVLKHAGARSVTVRLAWEPEGLVVTVDDDGSGLVVPRRREGGGQGLIGIRERAAAHGGTAASGPGPRGRGFRVAVRLPRMISSGAEVGG